jgi:phage gp29-like protein
MAALGAKGPSNDKIIIHQLAQEFADLSRKNIQSWRQGLQTAKNPEEPRWNLLQDLYEYLEPDGHYGSQVEIRNGSIEANRYLIRSKKDGKEDAVKSKFLEAEWFFELLGYMLDSAYKGYSPFQLYNDPVEGIKFDEIPRRNFIPQKNLILQGVGDTKGFDINDPAFQGSIIVVRHKSKVGIMNDIVPDLIWKRNARQTWAEFSEKFGIPLISATTNSRDTKEIDRIDAMLSALGKAAKAVLPTGTVVDIKDSATKGDPYNVFLKQLEYNDAQISKRILGGTMISDNGSSRSQSEVHERTMNYIIAEKERKRIEFIVNGKIIPLLSRIGIPLNPETDEFVFDRSEDMRLPEQWNIVSKALEHYDIPDQWVSETFNFPITGRRQPAAPPTNPEPKPGNAKADAGFFA